MFNKKNAPMGLMSSATLVSRNTQVNGDICFSGDLVIEGIVRGNIYVEDGNDANVRVLDKGLVEGEIRVPSVVINGGVVGDVYSTKHIELAAKAVVEGNVHYHLIEMVKGAQVNGNLVYSGAVSSKSSNKDEVAAKDGKDKGAEAVNVESAAAVQPS